MELDRTNFFVEGEWRLETVFLEEQEVNKKSFTQLLGVNPIPCE